MGNNQNQIIKQALEILSENNRFALKSITNDSAIKTNFYKLSDVDLRADLKDDIKDIGKDPEFIPIKTFEELEREKDPSPDPDPKPEPEDELEDESSKKDKPRNLFDILKFKIRNSQAIAIWNFLKETNPERLKGLSLGDIIAMNEEQRAELVGIEYKPGPKSPSNRILNTNIGRQ